MKNKSLNAEDSIGKTVKLKYGSQGIIGHVKSLQDGIIVIGDVPVKLPEKYEILEVKYEGY